MMTEIRVLVVDDQPAIRRGLRLRMDAEADIDVVGEAADGNAAIEHARALAPHVVVMDITMPGLDGIEATRQLRDIAPESKVIILSLHDDDATRSRANAAGAVAFVSKHEADAHLLDTIRQAALRDTE